MARQRNDLQMPTPNPPVDRATRRAQATIPLTGPTTPKITRPTRPTMRAWTTLSRLMTI
jgi:hypothetical protein